MDSKETIVFGGGCFWCTEAVFQMLRDVFSVEPGYAGGPEGTGGAEESSDEARRNPTYEDVCNGNTGHAEVIRIEYNPKMIPLDSLLTVFFATHDPRLRHLSAGSAQAEGFGGQATTKNRQGNDVGDQYRSIILYSTDEQKSISEKFIQELNESNKKGAPIVTEVKPLGTFYPAEDYHKNYYENNKNQAYCQVVINPKLKKVQEKFAKLLKK